MAKIISTEKPLYIQNQIEIYSKNRVGQYSKFLDKNPIFVTYYHVNQNASTQDVGTGNIESEIGDSSPIRFNKIINLPMYNIPELKPDVVYDESGYDIELECSDIVLLPNTIKPVSGDYFLVCIPGAAEYLFRVNKFSYNTIQSNDYYTIDADIKRIGKNLEKTYVGMQIIEEYYTIFDNIGTKDRCFLKNTDIDYVNSLADLFSKVKSMLKNEYYDPTTNAFALPTPRCCEHCNQIFQYDPYLEAFITRSNIFYEENTEQALVLSPACSLDKRFESFYNSSLYKAVIDRTSEMLKPEAPCITRENEKRYNIFRQNTIPTVIVSMDMVTPIHKPDHRHHHHNNGYGHYPYFPVYEYIKPQCPDECVPHDMIGVKHEYFETEFLRQVIKGKLETDDYLELIIHNYINRIKFAIDRKLLLESLSFVSDRNFKYLAIVAYIINAMYNEYFEIESDLGWLT